MSTNGDSLTIDVYHQAVFCSNPFVYFHHKKASLTNLDVCNMDFKVFKTYLQNLINNRCRDVYYCRKNRSLVDGLRELRDEEAIDKVKKHLIHDPFCPCYSNYVKIDHFAPAIKPVLKTA
ncbi:unnamed protein product [Lactuca saligna]|uniref:Uncharacterized protein n=1 Tax=Lactuca saligna TaxID=75948 RepID=A0AA36ELB1_LACSI|nr:unnamed protein product [Lactuca saligna]